MVGIFQNHLEVITVGGRNLDATGMNVHDINDRLNKEISVCVFTYIEYKFNFNHVGREG